MAWAVDQNPIGTLAREHDYGDDSIDFTTTAAAAAGSWVVLCCRWVFSANLASVTGGLTWAFVQEQVGGNDVHLAFAYAYAPSGLASSTVVTWTWDDTDIGGKSVGGASFTGGDADSFDAATTGTSGSGTGWTNAYTSGADGELLVTVAASHDGTNNTPTSATEIFDDPSNDQNVIGQYQVLGGAGSGSAAGTLSFGSDWEAKSVLLLEAAEAATAPQRFMWGWGL